MVDKGHKFGGLWTKQKLECLRKYLSAYTKIMSRNQSARFFETYYVDAFAGTGDALIKSEEPTGLQFFGQDVDALRTEVEEYIAGSARLALETEPPFDRFLFIEKKDAHCERLDSLKDEYPELASRVEVVSADANEYLLSWCGEFPRFNRRAVVFLDPYGMQVEWELVRNIAVTEAIDLWLLFPVSAVLRTLPHSGELPPSWRSCLTRLFGTEGWESEFYRPEEEGDLLSVLPDFDAPKRLATFEKIGEYFLRRLRNAFRFVADRPLTLCNSRGSPLYLFCFAANNPKAATAKRIAEDIMGKMANGA